MQVSAIRFVASAMLAVGSAGAVAAPAANPFCTEMKAIVADAPNGFAAFKGALARQEADMDDASKMIDHYAASGSPDGATGCEIVMQETATDGQHFPNYQCEFPIAGSNKGVATRKLATRVATCVVDISHPIGPGLSADSGMLTAHSKDYDVSYTFLAGPAKPTVAMLIQSERR